MDPDAKLPMNVSEKLLLIDIEVTIKKGYAQEEFENDEGHHGHGHHGHGHHGHGHHGHHGHNGHGNHEDIDVMLDIPPLFPPLGISIIKRYINDKTSYYARTFDAGIKITKDIELIYSGNKKMLLTPEQVESIIDLDEQSFVSLLQKSKKISLDSISLGEDNVDKIKLIYTLKRIQELMSESKVSDYGVIGFTVTTEISLAYSLLMSKIIKKEYPDKKIMFGGVFFDDVKSSIIEYDFVDFVVLGKGIVSTLKIMNMINGYEDALDSDGKILYKQSGNILVIEESRCVPFKEFLEILPDYDDFTFDDYKVFGRELMLVLMFASGCRYNCSFCSWSQFHKAIECADIDRFVDNILELKRRYGVSEFYITNSSINQNKEALVKFCKTLIEKKADIKYKALGNVEFMDDEVASLLKESGCKVLYLGVESFDDSVLERINKFHRSDAAIRALEICRKNDLFTIITIIASLPEETEEEHNHTRKLLKELDIIDDYAFFQFQVYPGSDVFNNPQKYGVKEIITTRKALKVPLEFGYCTEEESWEQISQKKLRRMNELKSAAYGWDTPEEI